MHVWLIVFRCYIQWTEHWDSNGMDAVAVAKLQSVIGGTDKDAPDMSKLAQQVQAVHNSRVAAGATPRHYLAFVSLCSSLYSKKRSQLLEQHDFVKVTNFGQSPLLSVELFSCSQCTNSLHKYGICCVCVLLHSHSVSCRHSVALPAFAQLLSCTNRMYLVFREAWASWLELQPLWTPSPRRLSSSVCSSKLVRCCYWSHFPDCEIVSMLFGVFAD